MSATDATFTDDEAAYTRDDVDRRIPLIMTVDGREYRVHLLGHGPHVALIMSEELAWPKETRCSLRACPRDPEPTGVRNTFDCPEGIVEDVQPGALDRTHCSLIYIRSRDALDRFFMTFATDQPDCPFASFEVPKAVGNMFTHTKQAYFLTDHMYRPVFTTQPELEITGLDEARILGRIGTHLWWESVDRQGFLDGLQPAEGGAAPVPMVFSKIKLRHHRPSQEDEPRWVQVTTMCRQSREGRFLGLEGAFQDMTGEVLKEIQYIERTGNLFRILGHQSRSPIINISNIARDIADGLIPITDAKHHAKTIHSIAMTTIHLYPTLKHLSQLINPTGDPLHLNKTWFELDPVILELVRDFTGYAEFLNRGFRIAIKSIGSVRLLADKLLIQQVLTCLLDNALKYSEETSKIEITGQLATDNVIVSVRSRGIPLRSEFVERVFERDFRTPEAMDACPDGTGLGLWLARFIMDLHGARILARGTDTTRHTQFDLLFPNRPGFVLKGD